MDSRLNSIPKPRLSRVGRGIAFVLILAVFAGTAMSLQHGQLKQKKAERPYRDSLFLPRKEVAKALAFGYDLFLADFLYLRSIQAFGGQWRSVVKEYKTVFDYFDTIAALDPLFTDMYEFGSMVMGDDGRDPKRAIALNREGWYKNPNHYKLAYLNAYIGWWTLKDPVQAKLWCALATRAKDCPEYVSRIAIYVDSETGRYEAALEKWISVRLDAEMQKNEYMAKMTDLHFLDITEKWNLEILHKALEQYRKDHQGKIPASLEELDAEGYLKNYKACDYSHLIALLETAIGYTGVIPPGTMEAITKQVFVTQSGIPIDPYNPGKDRYFLRKDTLPKLYDEGIKNRAMVLTMRTAQEWAVRALEHVRQNVKEFKKKNNRFPNPLDEAFAQGLDAFDVLTGSWNYDPKTGVVKSPTFPDL